MKTLFHFSLAPTPAGIMHRAATKIQKISRGFFGRRRFQLKLMDTTILHIQRVWRGAQCRTSADRAWLNKKVFDIDMYLCT